MPVCTCCTRHTPVPRVVHMHHVLPKAAGGTETWPSTVGRNNNLLPRCPSSHENFHKLWNLHVRFDGDPPWAITDRDGEVIDGVGLFSLDTRKWVEIGWNSAEGSRPYTTAH